MEINRCQKLNVNGKDYKYYSLKSFSEESVNRLPISIRILLESSLRKSPENCSQILNWGKSEIQQEIPFFPSRVLLQDYTGVPALVDLASMREAVKQFSEEKISDINPHVPVELVVDHSIQVDAFGTKESLRKNEEIEFERNKERFQLLKWAQKSFLNVKIVPPGSGIVHQVNLESLARVVFTQTQENEEILYPDSLVGTDSHTTMVNALGVLGWGVGGIEAEAVMLGEGIGMLLPQVVGVKVIGSLKEGVCATDVVLHLTNQLRKIGVVEKFVEFFGEGLDCLSLADRATLSNMCPEYGATVGFFSVDQNTLNYLRLTGRSEEQILLVEQYLIANNLFRNKEKESLIEWSQVVELDLNKVESVVAGPKRPQDMIPIREIKTNFEQALISKVGFNGFGVKQDQTGKIVQGDGFELHNGSVLIAAITSCTNTSNPFVLVSAGLLAKNAFEKGLRVPQFVKTSLSPGSTVVTDYLNKSGLSEYLDGLGFNPTGYGCMTCIGNSGELPDHVRQIVEENPDMVFASVLSGNRNFEGRVHPNTKANYLMSPVFVVAFALAGRVNIDFEKEEIGKGVFLKDIFPTREQVEQVINKFVTPQLFIDSAQKGLQGNENWKNLQVVQSPLFTWDPLSTYIKNPPYFKDFKLEKPSFRDFQNLHCILYLGDSITTDHISPAGNISKKGPTAEYLGENKIGPKDFNSYGSRRGNHEVMIRGTFANIKLKNKLVTEEGPYTTLEKDGKVIPIFEGCKQQQFDNLLVIAGKEYGTGSSRDWAGKGPHLLGIRVVLAESYERIHRSNLVGMGILPLQFLKDQRGDTLGLTGFEKYSFIGEIGVKGKMKIVTDDGKEFEALIRIDTERELEYFKNGGILQFVLRKRLN